MLTIADLKKGQKGIISDFSAELPHLKLLEMGCLPGNEVELVQIAPLKDPIYIKADGTHIAIRRETASKINVKPLKRIDQK